MKRMNFFLPKMVKSDSQGQGQGSWGRISSKKLYTMGKTSLVLDMVDVQKHDSGSGMEQNLFSSSCRITGRTFCVDSATRLTTGPT